jgi:predicted nucleic acid-binding protein
MTKLAPGVLVSAVEYSIDTNVLITAWHETYPPETFPRLWEQLDHLISVGTLVATEEVLQELEKREGDALYRWAKQRPGMFHPHTEDVQRAVKRVLCTHPRLINVGRNKSGGDPWVVAVAIVHQAAVVTNERPSEKPDKRPNIPDVCEAYGVRCITLVKLVQEQGWTFS